MRYCTAFLFLLFLSGCASSPASLGSVLPRTNGPEKGEASAKVTIEEFADFQCPACKTAARVADEIVSRHAGEVRLVWRQFPLTEIHAGALSAAIASECADDQGKFWEYHDALYADQKAFSDTDLKRYAAVVGLDEAKFGSCLENRATKSRVDADLALGQTLQIGGTPTFFVNGKPLPSWRPEVFESVVADAIAQLR